MKQVNLSRKFTIQDLILFCKDVNREYLTEPGLIFFDISIGHNQYISLGLSSVARGILYGYNLDGYYVCDSIDTFGDITHINLKPAE